ncbi:hypothetical protein ONZ45_g13880 [Pleurotus djamor]|nr:hypothetical protein ONZ45_g13880 [Pleurotus djamor]
MPPTTPSSPRDSGADAPAGTRNYPPDRLALVEDLLEKNMTRIVPSDRPRVPQTPGEIVVLLTGSTGALGSYLLKLLIDDTRIHHIYAHNRPASKSVYDRQATSFQEIGLDVSALSSSKITLLEGDMRQENLGLDALVYQNLLESVTVIVHNAWKLDFKASVSAFVPLITGTVNLINFGHQLHCSKPRLIFSSSITAVQNFGCDGMVPEAIIDDPRVSLGCGYGEAKYIVERSPCNMFCSHPATVRRASPLHMANHGMASLVRQIKLASRPTSSIPWFDRLAPNGRYRTNFARHNSPPRGVTSGNEPTESSFRVVQ